MITSIFKYQNGNLNSITVSGHANYKQKGEDIVCAAVSASTLVTANAIEHLSLNHLIDLNVSDGYFKVTVLSHHETIDGLLKNLEYTLLDLEKQYPKYMKNQKEG